LQELGQLPPVERMNQDRPLSMLHPFYKGPHFVGLQMTDKMPLDLPGEERYFPAQFLHPVLAEVPVARFKSLPDQIAGNGLCHQDHPDFTRFSPRRPGPVFDSFLNFLKPFIQNNRLNASIVVGSPDPHGPHKARARDGHYAIDLGLFLGGLCSMDENFSTKLDVDIDLKESRNLILVGGPVTNHVVSKINDFLPAKFSDKKPWGIITKKATYTEESIGMISRLPNPYNPEYFVLVLSGIRFIGTKAAVFAFTRNTGQVIHRFTGQKEFHAIVQGFDLDGDGKIDSVEILE